MLMAVMNSDVKDNHHFAGPVDSVCLTPSASTMIVVIEFLSAMMAEMKRIVATAVLAMTLFFVVLVRFVPGHAMVSLNVAMDLMNIIVLQ